MKVKLIIQIALVAVIIVLGFVLYESLMKPIRFENEFNRRKETVVQKLKEIRTLEEAYKSATGSYSGNIDSMVTYLRTAEVPLVRKIGNVPDTLTEAEALKRGIISRDTSYVNPIVKLREENKLFISDEELKNLKYIPYSNGEVFEVETKFIERMGFDVSVVEVKAPYSAFLHDLDAQLLHNRIAEVEHNKKYAGWKFGSLEQPIIDGNFE